VTAPDEEAPAARWCTTVTVCCPDQPSLVRASEAGHRMATGLALEGLRVHVSTGPYIDEDDE
jgi:hypothetical protein